jgi:MFS family permease
MKKYEKEELSRLLQHEHRNQDNSGSSSEAQSWPEDLTIDHDLFKAADTTSTSTSTTTTATTKKAMSLVALCICTFTQSWLMISVFPYSGFMAIYLIPHITEETAGPYAGLLASSFMIGRAVTSYGWGQLADIYGRRCVLFSSLGLSGLFSFLFGMSPTYSCALVLRFFCGFSNGMQGIVKTAVSELAHGDERWETHGMSIGESVFFCFC